MSGHFPTLTNEAKLTSERPNQSESSLRNQHHPAPTMSRWLHNLDRSAWKLETVDQSTKASKGKLKVSCLFGGPSKLHVSFWCPFKKKKGTPPKKDISEADRLKHPGATEGYLPSREQKTEGFSLFRSLSWKLTRKLGQLVKTTAICFLSSPAASQPPPRSRPLPWAGALPWSWSTSKRSPSWSLRGSPDTSNPSRGTRQENQVQVLFCWDPAKSKVTF